MKRITLAIAVVLVVALALAACTSKPSGGSSAPPAGGSAGASAGASAGGSSAAPSTGGGTLTTIGYNMGSDSIEFFVNLLGGMQAQSDKNGIKLLTVNSNFDPEKIMSNTEQLLNQGAQVIVDFNVNAEVGGNIVDVVKQRGGAGTISVDVKYVNAAGTDQAWFMGIDNQRAGELAGEAIGDALKSQNRTLEYLVLFFNSENGDLVKKRMGGAIDGLKTKGVTLQDNQIEWIDMGGGGSDTTIQGRDKFSAWLTAHPDVKTVATVAVNDETTQGLYAAAETANRLQDCLMTSHNVSEQFKQLALQGNDGKTWLGSVAYHPEMYGEYIVPLAMDIFAGKNTDPTKDTLMSPAWVPMSKDAVTAYAADFDKYTAGWKK